MQRYIFFIAFFTFKLSGSAHLRLQGYKSQVAGYQLEITGDGRWKREERSWKQKPESF
jgi:hypothetical protein